MRRIVTIAGPAVGMLLVAGVGWTADMGTAAPLKTAPGSKAETHNTEGIEHYSLGHWDAAMKHFTEAAKADPKSAEAHYNVALVLDKNGDHTGATAHFKTAHELGTHNPAIQDSAILKAHLKMK